MGDVFKNLYAQWDAAARKNLGVPLEIAGQGGPLTYGMDALIQEETQAVLTLTFYLTTDVQEVAQLFHRTAHWAACLEEGPWGGETWDASIRIERSTFAYPKAGLGRGEIVATAFVVEK